MNRPFVAAIPSNAPATVPWRSALPALGRRPRTSSPSAPPAELAPQACFRHRPRQLPSLRRTHALGRGRNHRRCHRSPHGQAWPCATTSTRTVTTSGRAASRSGHAAVRQLSATHARDRATQPLWVLARSQRTDPPSIARASSPSTSPRSSEPQGCIQTCSAMHTDTPPSMNAPLRRFFRVQFHRLACHSRVL